MLISPKTPGNIKRNISPIIFKGKEVIATIIEIILGIASISKTLDIIVPEDINNTNMLLAIIPPLLA